jgi:hypothetical protein
MTRQLLTKRCFLQERMLRSPQGRGLLRRLWYATTRLWARPLHRNTTEAIRWPRAPEPVSTP